jgi:hypothetical protein
MDPRIAAQTCKRRLRGRRSPQLANDRASRRSTRQSDYGKTDPRRRHELADRFAVRFKPALLRDPVDQLRLERHDRERRHRLRQKLERAGDEPFHVLESRGRSAHQRRDRAASCVSN